MRVRGRCRDLNDVGTRNMIDVYVINLAGQDARMEHMHAGLAAQGISFTRVEAVDGRRLSPAELAAAYEQPHRERGLEPKEIACALSHKRCWELLLQGNAPAAAIFEDDVHIADGIAEILADASWIPRGADIVRLETWRRKMALHREPDANVHGRRVYRFHSGTYGTAGYIMTRRAAEKALAAWPKVTRAVDGFLFDPRLEFARGLALYQFDPAPCIQDMRFPGEQQRFISTIGERTAVGFVPTLRRKLHGIFVGQPKRLWLLASTIAHGRRRRVVEFG